MRREGRDGTTREHWDDVRSASESHISAKKTRTMSRAGGCTDIGVPGTCRLGAFSWEDLLNSPPPPVRDSPEQASAMQQGRLFGNDQSLRRKHPRRLEMPVILERAAQTLPVSNQRKKRRFESSSDSPGEEPTNHNLVHMRDTSLMVQPGDTCGTESSDAASDCRILSEGAALSDASADSDGDALHEEECAEHSVSTKMAERDSDGATQRGSRKNALKKDQAAMAAAHRELAQNCFGSFECNCEHSKYENSCLYHIHRNDFLKLHRESYENFKDGTRVLKSKDETKEAVHQKLWDLRRPFPGRDGRTFQIPELKLAGHRVCKMGFEAAVGGSSHMHRSGRVNVCRGIDVETERMRKRNKTTLRSSQGPERLKGRREGGTYAAVWWAKHLSLQEFMPNSNRIQYRGPGWTFVHEKLFLPEARAAGDANAISYRHFKRCMADGLQMLHEEQVGAGHSKFLRPPRLVRAAKHANFPECTQCHTLRKEYLRAMGDPTASQEAKEKAFKAYEEHLIMWKEDRQAALKMKMEACNSTISDTLYQADDKCGSHFLKLPIDDSGRDSKKTAKAFYTFSLQSNMVPGQRGLNRLSIVPKHLLTGSNFGLTSLLLALERAFDLQRMKPHVTRLVRHSDGGSDNVSVETHFFHWLLVYLGVFEEVLWFRFDAGHSHTELSDRMFALLKQLFEASDGKRVLGIQSFQQLRERIHTHFKNMPEAAELAWLMANWDFKEWIHQSLDCLGVLAKFKKEFKVFRYVYDEKLHGVHGGVHVTVKKRLTTKAVSKCDCEYGPAHTETAEFPDEHGTMHERTVNVTNPNGIVFVDKPPNLSARLPGRELWSDEREQIPADACKEVLNKRDLSEESRAEWRALRDFHTQYVSADSLPAMPHTISDSETGKEFVLDGGPKPLLPILKKLMRFRRPLLEGHDPFAVKPEVDWPSHARRYANQEEVIGVNRPVADGYERRHVFDVGVVVHSQYSDSQRNAHTEDRDVERWLQSVPDRVSKVKENTLYWLELDVPDGELHVGLAEVVGEEQTGDGPKKYKVAWYERKSKKFKWASIPAFKPETNHGRGGGRKTGLFEIKCFRLEVPLEHLTAGGQSQWKTDPKLTANAMQRLRRFCAAKGLLKDNGSDEDDDADEDGQNEATDDDDERGEGGGEEQEEDGENHVFELPDGFETAPDAPTVDCKIVKKVIMVNLRVARHGWVKGTVERFYSTGHRIFKTKGCNVEMKHAEEKLHGKMDHFLTSEKYGLTGHNAPDLAWVALTKKRSD